MGWLIFIGIIVLLFFYWVSKTLFWILLAIVGFVLLIWLGVLYFQNEKNKKEHKDIQRRTHERQLMGQKERELKEQRELEIRALITSEIDKYLHKALEIMDSTDNWYNDEDEANKGFVSVLKAMGVEAVYLYRLSSGRTADAKVGDVLIEGKLSPDTAEVDRLIGQISHYVQYSEGNKVNIVIYGELTEEARERIEGEILQRYVGKVFLSYLDNPQRLRKV